MKHGATKDDSFVMVGLTIFFVIYFILIVRYGIVKVIGFINPE